MVNPPLKWPGGKGKLVDDILADVPEFACYHEPFIGGGAVCLDVAPSCGTINDINPRLTNFYQQVRDRPDELVAILREMPEPDSAPIPDEPFADDGRGRRQVKTYYDQVREWFNNRPNGDPYSEVEEAAYLLYLNRTCYNGLYRENKKGEFNASIGRRPGDGEFDYVREYEIHAMSDALQGVEIHTGDFAYVLDAAGPGDFVYLDPPYEPVSESADFTHYSCEGFDRDDQLRLLDVARQLEADDVHVVISNSAVMKGLYADLGFRLRSVLQSRTINTNIEKRGAVEELLADTADDPQTRLDV